MSFLDSFPDYREVSVTPWFTFSKADELFETCYVHKDSVCYGKDDVKTFEIVVADQNTAIGFHDLECVHFGGTCSYSELHGIVITGKIGNNYGIVYWTTPVFAVVDGVNYYEIDQGYKMREQNAE